MVRGPKAHGARTCTFALEMLHLSCQTRVHVIGRVRERGVELVRRGSRGVVRGSAVDLGAPGGVVSVACLLELRDRLPRAGDAPRSARVGARLVCGGRWVVCHSVSWRVVACRGVSWRVVVCRVPCAARCVVAGSRREKRRGGSYGTAGAGQRPHAADARYHPCLCITT